MKFRFAVPALICIASLFPSAGYTASFDCGRAVSVVEMLVCSDAELSSLDDALERAYRVAITRNAEHKHLILAQRQWLAQRNSCRNRECLIGAYWSRLADYQTDEAVPEHINCDPVTGEVDTERCSTPNSIKLRAKPEELRTWYCMHGPVGEYIKVPCTTEETKYVLARTRVAKGDQTFCRSLLTKEYTLIDLYLPHSISADEAKTYLNLRGGDTEIYPYAGFFDINNDGKPENIGWIKAYSGAGGGCDVERFVELDSERAHIADTKLTALLGEHNCRNYYRAFRYQGKTYLENRQIKRLPTYAFVDMLKEVLELNGSIRRSVCLFTYSNDKL